MRASALCSISLWLSFGIGLGACGDDGAPSSTEAGTTTSDPATTSGPATTGMPMTTGNADSTGAIDDSGDDGVMGECILYGADCSLESQKCMPWSLEDDRLPDETRCCALQDNPDLVGEGCTVQDYDGSCVDSCEEGSMCVVDDTESLSGTCRRFCNPGDLSECMDGQTCKTFFELLPTVLNVPMCMDKCDPLLQDCVQNGWLCIPDSTTLAGQSGFICVPPPPQTPKMLFDGCALANDCAAGLVCLTADRVPGCNGIACCSAYCSLAEGDQTCTDLDPDMRCVDWMSADPEWQDVGACALPQ
jgi:hypothetical protein